MTSGFDVAGAFASAKAALDIVKVAVQARDDAKAQAAIAELSDRLTTVSIALIDAIERQRGLQESLAARDEENAELKRQIQARETYLLHELRPGLFVRRFQQLASRPEQPLHYLCQRCFEEGHHLVLQRFEYAYGGAYLECTRCRTKLPVDPGPALNAPPPRIDPDVGL